MKPETVKIMRLPKLLTLIGSILTWTVTVQAGAAFVLTSGESISGEILRSNSDSVVLADSSGNEVSVNVADLSSDSIRDLEAWRASNPSLAEVYTNFDEPPAPVRTAEPRRNLIPRGASGMVSVAIVIDADGNVAQARIHRSQNDDLNEAALEAVNRWRFQPAKVGGTAVSCYIRVPLRFN